MEERGDIPNVLYLYIHSKIYENANPNNILATKRVKALLWKAWHIPKKVCVLFLKELEVLGLVEKHTKYELEIKKPRFSVDDCNEFYEQLNLFKESHK